MITIWKYTNEIVDHFELEMSKEAKILSVQNQKEHMCIYALVDSEAVKEKRRFNLYGTGHVFDSLLPQTYVGTFQMIRGNLVFHLFEKI